VAILQDILTPSVVTGIVARVATQGDVLQRHFGLQIGSPAEKVHGRTYSYDIFDPTRDSAIGRRPGTGPTIIAPLLVGKQNVTLPRAYEKMPLTYELLNNLRAIGKNAGERDQMGASYIEKQAKECKRRHSIFREVMVGGAFFRGLMYWRYDVPDDLTPVYTVPGSGGYDTMDWLIPAANKTQLNMTGGGNIIDVTWLNAAALIPTHVFAVNTAFEQLTGRMLNQIYLNSNTWNYVLQNTAVRNLAGSANKPYAEFTVDSDKNKEGELTGLFSASFNWCPWVKWHVWDGGVNVDGTFTKLIPDNTATFTIEHEGESWLKGVEGSEPVKENPLAPAVESFGFKAWVREWDEPARYELHTLQNWFLELNTPKAVAIGTVIF
jgi:hypothetical protein